MGKAINLFVVYGSETHLLSGLYKKDDSIFIRIFNSKRVDEDSNAYYAGSFEEFKNAFELAQEQNDIKRIVFIGAAFLSQRTLFVSTTDEEIRALIEVNISNYIKYTDFLLPHMLKLKNGYFIYLSSFRSRVTARGISLYAASKSFGETFYECIGKEYGALGVYASSIRMGYFDGRMTTELGDTKLKKIKLNAGNRKLGTPQELLKTINFLIDNPYTNGGVVDLTGGINHEF
jgi:NAD(P)-dependent dehydrogenase (short-subunit alcohol dehydrogenase family)